MVNQATNGAASRPQLTPETAAAIEAKWRQMHEAELAWEKIHKEALEAKGVMEGHRRELDLLFESAFEPRPLFDAIEEDGPAEPLAKLGINDKQLNAAKVYLRVVSAGPGPIAVKPLSLGGRPHVLTHRINQDGKNVWFCRPLYLASAFTTKFPDVDTADRPGGAGDIWLGTEVKVGKELYVVGPRSEQRRLEQPLANAAREE